MRLFGQEFKINGFRIYHEGDKPTPSEIGAAASNHTHTTMGAASASVAGKAGLVPAPPAGKQGQFLRGDATWAVPYTHPTTSGNKHIPSGGAAGQVLGYAAAGTAAWKTLTAASVGAAASDHTHAAMKAATASAAGSAGMVPAPPAGAQAKYLRGDGTWATPPGIADIQIGAKNLISLRNLTTGRVDASGAIYTGDTYAQTHKTTDYIPVTAGTLYTVSTDKAISTTQNYITVTFFTSAKAFISRPVFLGSLSAGWESTITAPATAAYARVSFPDANKGNVKFERGNKRTDWTPNPADVEAEIAGKAASSHTHANMKAATSSAAGSAGMVPAPAAGKQAQFLRGDGTWATPYTHPTTAGYKHIPSGGSSGQVLGYSSSGTAVWKTLTASDVGAAASSHTHDAMTAATASAAGKAGMVPAPAAGAQAKFLRGDGTWQVPYTHPTTAGNKHIPTGGSSGQVLAYSASGTAAWKTLAASDVGAAASSHTHSYLPLSGGSVTGNINMSEAKMLTWNNKGRIYMQSNQQMYLAASSEGTYYLHLGVHDSVWSLDPDTNGVLTLGTANHRWGQIYSSVASIKTSDRNQKKDIEPISERLKGFFRKLKPVSFRFIDGTSGRTHTGFIAQDVEEAMNETGLTAQDFAGFCKDQKTEPVRKVELVDVLNPETGEIEQVENSYTEDQPIEGEYVYGLRYEEFIALNTSMIQKLMEEVEAQRKMILELKEQVAALEAQKNQ